jgi:hypothetical protein
MKLATFLAVMSDEVPSDVGRISEKFKSVSKVKAEEWKNWALLFSEVTLRYCQGLEISMEKQRNWSKFVQFMQLMMLRYISPEQIRFAKAKLTSYLKGFRFLYSKWACVPNHHALQHMIEHALDIGPPLLFSAFP